MPMTPAKRKRELARRGKTMSAIARELGLAVPHVNQVVNGKRVSRRVQEAVARAIESTVDEVFGPVPNGVAA